jgi:putative transcriptional regulator
VRNRLRVLRAEFEWSQADLADRLGVSRQTVNAIETGKYDPSLPLAFKIGRLFSRPIESIFLPDDELAQPPHGPPLFAYPEAGDRDGEQVKSQSARPGKQ